MENNYYAIKTLLGPSVAESIAAYGGINHLLKAGKVEIQKVLRKKATIDKFMALTSVMDKNCFEDIKVVSSSRDAYNIIRPYYKEYDVEQFYVMYLNRANYFIKAIFMSKGSQAGTVVCAKQILKQGIMLNAAGMILVHNHPSGSLRPSDADIELTRKMKLAGQGMDLPVLDHLIITSDNACYSFADEGML